MNRKKRAFWDSQSDATDATKKRVNDIYRAIHSGRPKLNKDTDQFYYKKRTRSSHSPKVSVKYDHRTKKQSGHRPEYHFSSEVVVPPPDGFDVRQEFDEPGEAADLADDTYFHKQLKPTKPKLIHTKLKNVHVPRDVTLHQNSDVRKRPKQNEDNYEDDDDDDEDGNNDGDDDGDGDDDTGNDEYVDEDSDEGGDENEYDEVENPDVNTDYEIIETATPAPGPKPTQPRRPVQPRDPTLAVINAKNGRRFIPRRRPQPPHIPCNENVATVHHRQTKTKTSTRESIVKSTKKLHSPEELYAEIAKIIDQKKRNFRRPGHDKTHWELKIVPTHQDDGTRK